jgi:hypothetical protein
MPVTPEPTPNPNAIKFSVGQPVGGPGTFTSGDQPDEPFLVELLSIDGVTSVFLTADFVTVSKTRDGSWDDIVPEATAILERRF